MPSIALEAGTAIVNEIDRSPVLMEHTDWWRGQMITKQTSQYIITHCERCCEENK